MDTLSFLQRVLPSDGVYCAMLIDAGTVRNGFFTSVDELARATVKLNALGINTYYAVSSYVERGKRKQDNVAATKVIAMDLDVGPDDARKYVSWKDALKDLGRFIEQLHLPRPMVVHSGNGLHVYWVLTDALSPAQWKPLASNVKACAIANGLRIDPTVTADSARVLRAVGTINPKGGNEVRLLMDAPDVSPDTLRDCFGTTGSVTVRPPTNRPSSGLADSLTVKYDFPPANADVITSKCQQIQWAVENQKDVLEPMWYSVLGVAAFCHDPETVAIKWSQEHPDFDATRTLKKMYQWQSSTTGPTTCARLEGDRPNGCKGCKFKGHIGSPARLGLQYQEVAAPTSAPDPIAHNVTIPKPFKRTAKGIKVTVDDTDIDVCTFDLYPVSYGKDEVLNYEVVRFHWNRPHVGWQPLVLRQAFLTDGHREFASAIADQGIVLYNKKQTEFFQLMLRSYMDALRQQRTMTNLYSTMGWKDNFTQFVIGDSILRRDSSGTVVEDKTTLSSVSQKLGSELWTQNGSLDEWVEFTSLLGKAHLPWHMFALAVGISAPLYAFTGLKGLTLSLYGPTGGGKTLIQYWQQSVWGDPERLHFAAKFTQNTLFSRMGMYCHMPMTIDEATMMNDKEVGDFCYWVSQGRDKARLSRNAVERDTKEWALPVTVSTNKSMASKMIASGLETDAQMARLLEINVPPHALFTRDSSAGRRIYEFLTNHHGTMGREFVRRLLEIGDVGIRAMIAEHTASFHKIYKSKFSGEERFWEQAIILADLAAKLAYEWGLIKFEYTLGTEWVLKQLGAIRRTVMENKVDAFDLMSEYLNDCASAAVTVMHTLGQKPALDFAKVPKSDIRIRFDIYRTSPASRFDKGTLTVDRTHFRKWLATRGGDYKTFMHDIETENIVCTPKSQKAYLGKDTPVKLGQSYVVSVNLNHPRLRGILDDADQAADDAMLNKLQLVQG